MKCENCDKTIRNKEKFFETEDEVILCDKCGKDFNKWSEYEELDGSGIEGQPK